MKSKGVASAREVITIAIDQLDTVIQRLSSDQSFRLSYCRDPDSTLRSYLSPEQIRAIKSGDGHLLGKLGARENWAQLTAALCGPFRPVD